MNLRHRLAASVMPAILIALALPALAEPASEPVDPWRLDGLARPGFQFVDLQLDPGSSGYSGSTRIELTLARETDRFLVQARDMELAGVRIDDGSGPVDLAVEPGEEGLQTLVAPAPLPEGDYTLELEFSNDYDIRATSLYKVQTGGEDYLFTQFEATDARGAFPCFDEPEYKIEWQLALTVPEGDVALSNTPVESEEPAGAGMRRVTFMRTRPMPSYLVALAVGPFELVDVPGTDVPCRVVTVKGKAAMAADAVRTTPPILAALEDYFGRPYPYRKLDLVAVPEFLAGAMENVGLITFRETILLLDPENASVDQRRNLCSVNAHEIAHQWYGNLVTMKWWDDLWLNESFATWMGEKITDQVFPEFEIAVTGVRGMEFAKQTDTSSATEAIRAPVISNAVFESMDASITYQKGEAVLGMFEHFVGEDAFREGVRSYIDHNAWGSTEAGDLLDELTAATGVDFRVAMGTFLDQPGVPEVAVSPLGDGKVELAQARFHLLDQDLAPGDPWHIPVVLKYSDGEQVREHRVMLDEESEIIDLGGGTDPEWIHPNADERGYYRWDVGPDRLLDMVDRSAEILSPRERVALASQVSAQMGAGRISGGDYLRATTTLLADPRPEVVDTALRNLGEVRVAFVTADLMPAFRQWVRAQLAPLVAEYSMVPQPGEPEGVSVLRPALLAWDGTWGADEAVRRFAREQVEAYLDDRQAVDASIAGTCVSIAAIDGDWKLYNRYMKAFESAEVPAQRSIFLRGLGSFGDPSMQAAALDFALSGDLRPQELFSIPRGVAERSWDQPDRMWNWFVENYDRIVELMPPQFKTYMPYFAAGCEEERLVAAREFFSVEEHQAPGQAKMLERVAESVTECADLRRREGPSVREFLLEGRSR